MIGEVAGGETVRRQDCRSEVMSAREIFVTSCQREDS